MRRERPVHKLRNMCEDGCGQVGRTSVHQPVELDEVSYDGGGILLFAGKVLLAMRDGTPLSRDELVDTAVRVGLMERLDLPTGHSLFRFTDTGDLCIEQVPVGTIQ
jgi:hypothetical protein